MLTARSFHRALFAFVALGALSLPAWPQESRLFPAREADRTGRLAVSDLHELYWEETGNPEGVPVVVLHGGPGGKASPVLRRLFDPDRYRIVLFDQRGAGRSRPFAEWRENRTELLVEDIEALRAHLELGPRIVVFGLSWGTTLALAWAETHPEAVAGLVLAGVFTCTAEEIDHLYGGAIGLFYPERYERLHAVMPEPSEGGFPGQLFALLAGEETERAAAAAQTFVAYEESLSSLEGSWEAGLREAGEEESRSLALLENYYLANGCFFERERQLWEGLERISRVPTAIVNGRYDLLTPPRTAWALSKHFETVRLDIVPAAGHVDLRVALGVVDGAEWLLDRIDDGDS